jgi:cytochrome b561
MVRLIGVLLILGTATGPALALEGAAPVPAATPASGSTPAAPPEAAPVGTGEALKEPAASTDFDFNLLPPTPKTAEDKALESSLATRRTLLQLHQGFGIATTALMLATVIVGQLNYTDKFGGGTGTGQYELAHTYLATATTLSFVTAGILALAAPVPLKKHQEGFDTMDIHKWAMLIATVGFVAQIVLGIITVSQEGAANQASLATAHLVVGYGTLAAMGTGVTVLFFE